MSVAENQEKVLPVAPLKIAYLEGSRPIAKQINASLVKMRSAAASHDKSALTVQGYVEPSYLLDTRLTRYGTGTALPTKSAAGSTICRLTTTFRI